MSAELESHLGAGRRPATSLRGTRSPRTLGLVVIGGAAAGAAILLARAPVAGAYPACPWKSVTGLDCPFCGGLRSVAALAHGDLPLAVDYNLLVAIGVPIAIVLALVAVFLGDRAREASEAVFSRPVVLGVLALAAAFFVLRLLPFASWLTSTA